MWLVKTEVITSTKFFMLFPFFSIIKMTFSVSFSILVSKNVHMRLLETNQHAKYIVGIKTLIA